MAGEEAEQNETMEWGAGVRPMRRARCQAKVGRGFRGSGEATKEVGGGCHELSALDGASPAWPVCHFTLRRAVSRRAMRAVVSQVGIAQLLGHLEEVGRVLLGGALQ